MAEENMPENKAKRLGELAEKYGDNLLRTCFLYLNNMTMAEDAVQDTFLRVYENMDSFREDSSVKTWITRIAINICKDYQKSNWHKKVQITDVLKEIPCNDHLEEDDEIIASVMALPAAAAVALFILCGSFAYASNIGGLKDFFTPAAKDYQVETSQKVKSKGNTILLNSYLYDQTGYIYLSLDCSKGPDLTADFDKIKITLSSKEKNVVVDNYGTTGLEKPDTYMMEIQNKDTNFTPSKVTITLDKESYSFSLSKKKLAKPISCPLDSGTLEIGLCNIAVSASSELAKNLQRDVDWYPHDKYLMDVTLENKDGTTEQLTVFSYSAGSAKGAGFDSFTHLQCTTDAEDGSLYTFDTKNIKSITLLGKTYSF